MGVPDFARYDKNNPDYEYYDGAGNLLAYQLQVYTGDQPYTNTIGYDYIIFDGYQEERLVGDSTYFLSGSTISTYDINGNRIAVDDIKENKQDLNFIVNDEGKILRKTQNGNAEHYFYGNGKSLGRAGRDSEGKEVEDFDFNFVPVSSQYPSSTPNAYQVNKGDTLASIAAQLYGDASLWYVIADANGLNAEQELQVGLTLTIPNIISNSHNTADTFKPYNPSDIVGDTTPTLPNPPPPPVGNDGGCGALGVIVMVVVTIVVAYFAPYLLDKVFAALTTVVGSAAAAVGAVVVTGVAVGAVNQTAAIAVGAQEGFNFSWRQVLSDGIGAYFGSDTFGSAKALTPLEKVSKAAISSVRSQAVNMVIGTQEKFDWRSVAVSAVAQGLNNKLNSMETLQGIEGRLNIGDGGDFNFGTSLREALVNQSVRAAVYKKGKFDWTQVAADSFGNALSNHIAENMDKPDVEAPVELENSRESNSEAKDSIIDTRLAYAGTGDDTFNIVTNPSGTLSTDNPINISRPALTDDEISRMVDILRKRGLSETEILAYVDEQVEYATTVFLEGSELGEIDNPQGLIELPIGPTERQLDQIRQLDVENELDLSSDAFDSIDNISLTPGLDLLNGNINPLKFGAPRDVKPVAVEDEFQIGFSLFNGAIALGGRVSLAADDQHSVVFAGNGFGSFDLAAVFDQLSGNEPFRNGVVFTHTLVTSDNLTSKQLSIGEQYSNTLGMVIGPVDIGMVRGSPLNPDHSRADGEFSGFTAGFTRGTGAKGFGLVGKTDYELSDDIYIWENVGEVDNLGIRGQGTVFKIYDFLLNGKLTRMRENNAYRASIFNNE